MEKTISILSYKLGIPKDQISKAYKAYWKFIRSKIEELPLKGDIDVMDFDKMRTSFNIQKLGKLYCSYDMYNKINKIIKDKDDKHKEDKIDS